MVTVTVGAVVHNLAVARLTQRVDLPEDDATVTRASQSVAADSLKHLLLSHVAVGYYSLAEVAIAGLTLLPHRCLRFTQKEPFFDLKVRSVACAILLCNSADRW